MGSFKLREFGSPSETMFDPQMFWKWKNVLEVLLSACQVLWGSDFTCHWATKNVCRAKNSKSPSNLNTSALCCAECCWYKYKKIVVEFFLCWFARPTRLWTTGLWTAEFECMISPWMPWSTETVLMPLNSGRFVVVHSHSTFSTGCQMATPQNAEAKKCQNLGFSATPTQQNKPIKMKFCS